MNLGDKLKKLRITAGISRIELAKEIGVSKSAICLWELNQCKPSLNNLVKLANYFNVTVENLVSY